MSRVSDYAYINARLRARIGIMRSSDIIENMIKAPTLVEAVAKLDGTRHQHIADVYRSTGDLEAAELSLIEEQVASYREVVPFLPSESSFFMTVLLEKLEMENLKTAIRLWYSASIMHHSISDRAKYVCRTLIVHPIDYDRIMNASAFGEVETAVAGTPYKDILSAFTFESLSKSGLFPLEIALDHMWFSHLMEAIRKLPSVDRHLAEDIYNVDIDLKNILILVRYGYYYHLEGARLSEVIIPAGYIGTEAARRGVLKSDDPIASLKDIVHRRYPAITEEIDNIRRTADDFTTMEENARQIMLIENYLAAWRLKAYQRLLLGKPFSIGVVLSYFFLERQEDSMIQAVLSAKSYSWSEGKIREALGL